MGNHPSLDDRPRRACKPHPTGAGGEAFDLATELLAHTFTGIFERGEMGLLYMPYRQLRNLARVAKNGL